MTRTVLVTGAAGWIGSHVVKACRAQGWRVLALGPEGGASADADAWISHRCTAEAPLPQDVSAFDGLIHLAWPIDPATYLSSPANLATLAASIAVVEAALARGCARIVIAGTCAEYARTEDALIDEDAVLAPDTLYASCKAALHTVAQALCLQAQVPLVWARIFHLYGPGENPARLIPALFRTFRSGAPFTAASGRQRRDFLRVEDVALGFATLLSAPGAQGAYNVCSGEAIALADIMRQVHDLCAGRGTLELGAKPDRAWEPESLVGSSSKLRSLGWKPEFTLSEGLREYGARLPGFVGLP